MNFGLRVRWSMWQPISCWIVVVMVTNAQEKTTIRPLELPPTRMSRVGWNTLMEETAVSPASFWYSFTTAPVSANSWIWNKTDLYQSMMWCDIKLIVVPTVPRLMFRDHGWLYWKTSDIHSMFMLDYPSAWLYESALWKQRILLPKAGRKIADWLIRGYIHCANKLVCITWCYVYKHFQIDHEWFIALHNYVTII